MRFKGAVIKDFKRFTHLTVEHIPETARLLMLAGPNGSGKSSFFDAMRYWSHWNAYNSYFSDHDYYLKTTSKSTGKPTKREIEVEFHPPQPHDSQEKKKLVYTRSAYRNDPEFQTNLFRKLPHPLDESRVSRMIDDDAAIGRNYQRILGQLYEIFDSPPILTSEFTDSLINPIRDPVMRLFPELVLNSLANPMEDATFRFTKGASEGFHYKNLSGGEKAVFDLVLDMVVATRVYDNTVFCIDEPESHLNGSLQADLLAVLYDLIPEDCQLMLATHSIGMMRRARDIERDRPGSVVFLDFGGLDFDEPVVIEPTVPDRIFWTTAYHVALDDLASLVAPERVVICEGEPKTEKPNQNYAHDARCYETIFNARFPETQFIPGGSDKEVVSDRRGLAYALGILTEGTDVVKLIDRNSRSPEQIAELVEAGVRVLSRRNLETFLFDAEVLTALAFSETKGDKVQELLDAQQRILRERTVGAVDDLKPVSDKIYYDCKRILELPNPGNDPKSFMRDTLAPLVEPGMVVYDELRMDIFGLEQSTDDH